MGIAEAGLFTGIVVRTLVSAGELSLSCARLLAGWVTTLWLSRPLPVSKHGQLSLPSLRGRIMSSNPCYSGLRRQTAEGVVRGVAYRPHQRVLLAARLECRLATGSRPRIGDERRSLALWAVGEPTSHWELCLCCLFGHHYVTIKYIIFFRNCAAHQSASFF